MNKQGLFMFNYRKLFAARVAFLREKKGLTQEKLAELVGRSTNHISKIETAGTNPSFDLIVRLAHALNVDLKDLFNFDSLNDINFIKEEFKNYIEKPDENHLKLLYKIHKDLIN